MISKLMLLEQVTIQEKKQLLLNKGIPNEIIDKLLQCDPTNKNKSNMDKVGSYTDWIFSRYLKDRSFDDFDKLQSQLQQYNKSKHKIPDKQMQNIGNFNTLDDLITFVNNNQDKLAIASEEFVVKTETDHDMFYSRDFVIHVPHSKEQSIKLGSGTKWCTSQIKDNLFNEYYRKGYLFYITNKSKNQERYNLHLKLKYGEIEFADDKDRHLPYKLFNIVKQDNTLIPQIKKYFEYKNTKVDKQISEFLNCNTVYDVVQWYKQNIFKNADIYFETDEQKIIDIIYRISRQYIYISNPSHKAQLQQVSTNGNQIKFIENPDKDIQLQQVDQDGNQIQYIKNPDKEVQIQQVSNNGYQIRHIIRIGIIPDKDVQLQQVSQNGFIISMIKNPDKDVQMQQVKENASQLQYIKNPDKEVQLQQVSKEGSLIEHIKKPDKEVQIQQVSKNGYQIYYIISKKIKPDKDVQLQQVSNNGQQIQYIKNPDKDVQLQQVNQNGLQIQYIENPDKDVQIQQVKENGSQFVYIKNPDKKVQLQQVKQAGYQIGYIENPDKEVQLQQINQYPKQYSLIYNPDPEQTQLYKRLVGIKESATYINKLLDVN